MLVLFVRVVPWFEYGQRPHAIILGQRELWDAVVADEMRRCQLVVVVNLSNKHVKAEIPQVIMSRFVGLQDFNLGEWFIGCWGHVNSHLGIVVGCHIPRHFHKVGVFMEVTKIFLRAPLELLVIFHPAVE